MRAWTLLETIAVLAVIALLVTILLPVLLKEIDKSVSDQEKAKLKSFSDAFQEYVLSSRSVPDETAWYSAVASQLGFSTNDVLYNVRQQAQQPGNSRVFLIDPNLALGSATNGLPYDQSSFVANVSISPIQPTNSRLMIVSSLGKALPSTVASGVYTSSHPEYFDNLWTNADGAMPPGAAWTGWNGDPADVIVQRIDLAPLFVHLLLGQYNSTNSGSYRQAFSIDASSPFQIKTVDGYFIQGSVLGLYTNSTGLDARQILTRDSSFVFENGVWRGSLSGGTMGANGIGVINLADVVQQFLVAPANFNAQNPNGNAQQVLVVNSMLNYMSNYNVWALPPNNFNNNSLKDYLKTLQTNMMNSIQGLYYIGTPSYYPTNPSPCVN